ncbi:hypothetical protein pb186bvf_009498 [Paramecium bursaria]
MKQSKQISRPIRKSSLIVFQEKIYIVSIFTRQNIVALCFFNSKYPEVEIVEIADTIMYQNSIQMLLTRPAIEILYQYDTEAVKMIEIMKQYEQLESLKYQNFKIQKNQYYDSPLFKDKFQKPKYMEFAFSCLKQRVFSIDQFSNSKSFEVEQIKILDIRDYMEMEFTITEQVNLIPDLLKLIKPVTFCGAQLLKASLIQPMFGSAKIKQRQNFIQKLISQNFIPQLDVAIQCINKYDQSVSDILCQCKKVTDIQKRLVTYIKFFDFIKALDKLLDLLIDKDILQIASIDIECIRTDINYNWIAEYIRRNISRKLDETELTEILTTERGLNNLDDKRQEYKKLQEDLQKYQRNLVVCRDMKLIVAHISNSCYDEAWCFQIQTSKFNNQDFQIEQGIQQQNDKIINVIKQGSNTLIFTSHLFNISCQLKRIKLIILQTQDNELNNMNYQIIQSPQWLLRALRVTSEIDLCLSVLKYYKLNKKKLTFPQISQNGIEIVNAQSILESNQSNFNMNFVNLSLIADDSQNNLQKPIKLVSQYIILAQNGFPVPCDRMSFQPFKNLGVYQKSYHQQNMKENHSSFTAEISGLSRLVQGNQFSDESLKLRSTITSQLVEQNPKLILIETLVNCSSPPINNCMGQAIIQYLLTSTVPLTGIIGIKQGDLNISYFDQVYFYTYSNEIFHDMDQQQIIVHFNTLSSDHDEEKQQFLKEFQDANEIQEEFSQFVIQHLYSKMKL